MFVKHNNDKTAGKQQSYISLTLFYKSLTPYYKPLTKDQYKNL